MHLPTLHGLDIDRTLHTTPGAVLLVFTKPGCGACRALKAALAAAGELEGLTAHEVDVVSAPALVDELDLYHLPAMWLFADGEPVTTIDAPPSPEQLRAALASAVRATL